MGDPPDAAGPQRVDPPFAADERTMLEAWLDYHRATLLLKCADLSPDDLRRRSVPPSTLSLLGLVRHMTDVERNWFARVLDGDAGAGPLHWSQDDEDGDFDNVDTADADADLALYAAEVERCRARAAAHGSLDVLGARRRDGHDVSLRWIYVHMIEEYARHNGHADLLRERIDGRTGE